MLSKLSNMKMSAEKSLVDSHRNSEKVDEEQLAKLSWLPVALLNLEYEFGLMDRLKADRILSEQMCSDINRDGLDRYDRCRKLLSYITNSKLSNFLSALRETKQSHLALYIERNTGKRVRQNHEVDNWPLTDRERDAITRLQVTLVEMSATKEVVDELFAAGAISDQHKKYCIEKHATTCDKNRELLDIIKRRSVGDVKKFRDVVIQKNSHLREHFKLFNDICRAKNLQSENVTVNLIQCPKISNIAVVNNHIFIVLTPIISLWSGASSNGVKVYNLRTLTALPDINIPEMKDLEGMAGCSHNKVLYICAPSLQCIHRVNITDNSVKRWSVRENCMPRGLSVTSEHNVLVTVQIRDTEGESGVVEYTSEGQLTREIKLDRSIDYAWQTLELSTDQFFICHGVLGSSLHRVCVINSEGEIMKCFGGEEGEDEGQLHQPWALTIDKNRQVVFVADCLNDRVVMLDYEMNYLGLVQSRESLVQPSLLYFDLHSDQLIVGEGWPSTRLTIISPDRSVTE